MIDSIHKISLSHVRKQHKHTTNNNGEIKTANKASISNIEAKSTKKGSKETDKSGA
jgi:hypothetical protein